MGARADEDRADTVRLANVNAIAGDGASEPRPSAEPQSMTNVVIVDDEALTSELLVSHLKLLRNTEVNAFSDPIVALSWCRANVPDLVLLDYQMPDMDGVEFLRHMRAGHPLANVHVIMITARDRGQLLAEVLNFGMTDFLHKPFTQTELLARTRNMLELAKRQRQLELANRQLYVQATTDPLTGLKNRRHFLGTLEHEIERNRRYARPCSLALIDLDHFKLINDMHGHDAGDHVLREFSLLLMAELRSADHTGRLGGEEFAILFPETELARAVLACEHLQAELRLKTFAFGGVELRCAISIGLTEVDQRGDDLVAIMKRADEALYRAKASGRDRIEIAAN